MSHIVVETWGDFACFTQPETKADRYSYPIMTPSAAKGLLSAVYCKPVEFRWEIEKIEVLNPIKTLTMLCSEATHKLSTSSKTGAPTGRTLRYTSALLDVRYRIHANIIPRKGQEYRFNALLAQAKRRFSKGQQFKTPCFGLREFTAYFELYDPAVHTKKPEDINMDIGYMVYDTMDPHNFAINTDYSAYRLSLFHAKIVHGVMTVPSYDSDEVIKSR